MDKYLYNKVFSYVSQKHGHQKRKNNELYLKHLIRVSKLVEESGYDEKYQIVALLHDVLEDTNATEDELLSMVDKETVECVKVLTRTTSNEEYVKNILNNKIAIVVKSADIIDNMLSAGVLGRNPQFKEWSLNYISNAEKYYMNKFCKATDRAISIAKELITNDESFDEAFKKIEKIEIY